MLPVRQLLQQLLEQQQHLMTSTSHRTHLQRLAQSRSLQLVALLRQL
jgi:hypothetical protein